MSPLFNRFCGKRAGNRYGILAGVFRIGEVKAVGSVYGAELKAILVRARAECLDVVHVEDKLDDRLATTLPLRSRMKHDGGTSVRGEQLHDPVAGHSHRSEAEVLLVEASVASTSRA
ncbi:hypothetical protein ABIA19_005566 [Sinorhizobium fredii]